MQHCFDHNVSGVIIRTDWDIINDASAFNSLNMLNVHAAAALSADLSCTDEVICRAWMERGITTALQPESMRPAPESPHAANALAVLRRIRDATWPIVQRALHTRGRVFQYSSKIAPTLDEFFFVARSYHAREDWDPGALAQIEPTPENVRAVLAEKDEALQMDRALRDSAAVDQLGVSEELTHKIRSSLDLLVRHVDLYRYVVSAGS